MMDRHLGAQVRRYRQAQGLTQQALGNRIGVPHHQIQSYEAGIERMAPGTLIEIAGILDIELTELFQKPTADRPSVQ